MQELKNRTSGENLQWWNSDPEDQKFVAIAYLTADPEKKRKRKLAGDHIKTEYVLAYGKTEKQANSNLEKQLSDLGIEFDPWKDWRDFPLPPLNEDEVLSP